MKKILFVAFSACFMSSAFAQKEVSSLELLSQIGQGKSLSYENVIVTGDIDLSKLDHPTETGKYIENGKTAYVLSHLVQQAISFKNCTFKGKLIFCTKTESNTEKREYRVEFAEDVILQNCRFEKTVDFELTNFGKAISLEGSVFKDQPKFVRIGLTQKPNLEGLKLEKGCLFQLDQSTKVQVLTAAELSRMITAM